jgi:L-fuconolactonase
MIIDAHQHVWDLAGGGYSWLGPGHAPIDRTVDFAEIRPSLTSAGVERTVLVQADDTDLDTDHMRAVAAAHPEVIGVVGWVPLDDPERAEERLGELRRDSHVVGIRALIHDYEDVDWIVRDAVGDGLEVVARFGIPYDFVTASPEALRHLPALAERNPGLRMVIDHLGKPPIGGSRGEQERWRYLLARAASNPLTHAKVSGLYSAVGPLESWTVEGLRPFFDIALDAFGASRLMLGGDWPVALRAGGYERCWAAYAELTADLTPGQRADLYGATAERFYGLGATSS